MHKTGDGGVVRGKDGYVMGEGGLAVLVHSLDCAGGQTLPQQTRPIRRQRARALERAAAVMERTA
eukprot:5158580-Prymnesium_polylepis.2